MANRFKKILYCWFFCTLSAGASALNLREPDFPAPPNASVEVVSNNMEINGIATGVRAFTSRDKMGKIVNFYKDLWHEGIGNGLPGFTLTNAMEPWILLSRIEKGYLMTVQVQPKDSGGSWGYLAISRIPKPPEKGKKPVEIGKQIPKMDKSHVLNEIKSRDAGQSGRSVVVLSPHSVASNVNFYRNHYATAGWSTAMDRPVETGKMHSFSFKQGRKRVNIMIMGDHTESRVVVNEVVHDIL